MSQDEQYSSHIPTEYLNKNEYINELAVWEKVIDHPELLFAHVTGSQQDFSNLLQNFSESIICTKENPKQFPCSSKMFLWET